MRLYRHVELSLRESVVLAQLVVAAGGLRLALRFARLQRITDFVVSRASSPWLGHFPLGSRSIDVAPMYRIAHLAARVWSTGPCLLRSLLMLWMLRVRGEAAELVVGVARNGGEFEAHAWTVVHDSAVAERPEIAEHFSVILGPLEHRTHLSGEPRNLAGSSRSGQNA